MKSLVSNTIARKMTIGIAILLVGITAFGITVFGITDKTYAAESTLSLSIDNSAVKVDVAPTSTNGTFRKGTASTISASTDNATGYTLSISAPSASGSDYDKLINTSDNTAKISSISSPTTEEQYKALNNTSYNNTWGYLPSKYCSDGTSSTCTTNTDFLPAPTTTGDVLDQTTAANTTANTYTIGMGTRIDSTTKTGKYQGSFIVKLVANAIPYTIIYDDNVVSNMPTDVFATTPDTSVAIDSKTPVRAGYKFLGWCTVVPTSSNGTDTCTGGTQYQPSATLTIDQTGTGNNFHFYAMWKEDNSMQSFTTAKCSAMSTGSTITLTDSRDDQAYTVGKLADGKCWMVENLNLAGGAALSADNTDVDVTYINSFTTSNNLTKDGNTIKLPASAKAGFNTNNYSYVYNSGNKSTTCTSPGCYSYYSWDAATLGSGRSISTDNTDVPYSICPKGWHLPNTYFGSGTAAEATDFRKLMIGYGGYNYVETYTSSITPTGATMYGRIGPGTTPNFLLAGYYYNGSFYDGGSRGYYWSSTSYSHISNSRNLYFYSSYVGSANYNQRLYGYSVRCLFSGQ